MASVIITGVLSLVSAVVGLLLAVRELRRDNSGFRTRWERIAVVVILVGAGIVGGVAAYHTLPKQEHPMQPVEPSTGPADPQFEPTTMAGDSSAVAPATDTVITDATVPVPKPEEAKTDTDTASRPPRPASAVRPSIRITDERGVVQADLVGAVRAALPAGDRTRTVVTGQLAETCGPDEVFPNIVTCRVRLKLTIQDLAGGIIDGFTFVTRGGDALSTDAASEQARGRLIADIRNRLAKKDE